MKCDMCGKKGRLYKAVIEDAHLIVCHDCTKFGKVIEEINATKMYPKKKEDSVAHIVVEDYSAQIKNKREKLGLTQDEFAKKLNEKTSIIHQLESGHMKPSAQLANKLLKTFGLKLVEEYKETHETLESGEAGSFTLGDFIKKKK